VTFRIIITLVVIAAIVGVFMLARGPASTSARAATDADTTLPGYAARNAEVVETGDDGRPLYTLNADLVRQHPNDSRVQLDAPRMTFTASDGNLWHVRARSGQISADGVNVDLFGDVQVEGVLPGAAAPATINTSVVSFDTRTELVTTHAPVTLDWSGRQMSASGLVANLKDRQVKLESRVHGLFEPN